MSASSSHVCCRIKETLLIADSPQKKKRKKRLASSCEMLPPGRFGPDADVRDKMAASRVGRRFRPLDLEVDLTNTSRSTFARQRNPDMSVCLLSD